VWFSSGSPVFSSHIVSCINTAACACRSGKNPIPVGKGFLERLTRVVRPPREIVASEGASHHCAAVILCPRCNRFAFAGCWSFSGQSLVVTNQGNRETEPNDDDAYVKGGKTGC
jgi:hypothetical protein